MEETTRVPIAEQNTIPVEVEEVKEIETSHEPVDAAAAKEAQREAEARAGGWVPLEEWRGDPEDHVSAKEFLRFGRHMEPLKRQLQEERERNGKFVKEIIGIKQQLEAESKAKLEAEIARLNQIKKEAFERADFTAYQAAEEEGNKIRQQTIPVQDAPNAIFSEWQAQNTWYTNPVARQEADLRGAELMRSITGDIRPPTEFEYKYVLDKVAAEIGAKHIQRPVQAPPVQPAKPSTTGAKPKQRTFNSLDADAKDAFLRFQRSGIYKNTGDIERDAAAYIRDLDSGSTSYTIRSN